MLCRFAAQWWLYIYHSCSEMSTGTFITVSLQCPYSLPREPAVSVAVTWQQYLQTPPTWPYNCSTLFIISSTTKLNVPLGIVHLECDTNYCVTSISDTIVVMERLFLIFPGPWQPLKPSEAPVTPSPLAPLPVITLAPATLGRALSYTPFSLLLARDTTPFLHCCWLSDTIHPSFIAVD